MYFFIYIYKNKYVFLYINFIICIVIYIFKKETDNLAAKGCFVD